MTKVVVKFDSPESIEEFVNITRKYPYDMDLSRGKFMVDAKSFLGIMNMGVSNEITLRINDDSCEELKKELGRFLVRELGRPS